MKLILYTALMLVAALSAIMLIHFQSSALALNKQLIAENAHIMDQVGSHIEDRISSITDGWIHPGAARREREYEIRARVTNDQKIATTCAWVTGGTMILAVLTALFQPSSIRRRQLGGVSFGCWVIGIVLPVLTITVSTSVNHIGTLILREETKSLLSMLANLISQDNWLMVTLIGAFGICVPLLKTACNFAPNELKQVHRFGSWLSRWSLIDVVVIGVAVAFLGGQGDSETHTKIGLGFWFFSGCGIVSLLIGMMESDRATAIGSSRNVEASYSTDNW